MGDWRQQLAEKFNTLAASAREETKVIDGGLRGVKGADGIERIHHVIVTPQECKECGLLTSEPHARVDCIRELKAALRYAQGNIQVIRHG